MDAAFLTEAFADSLKITNKWAAEQERSESLFAALIDFHARLQLLGRGAGTSAVLRAFQAGSGLEEVPELLHARHVRGLENLMAALHKSASRFESHHSEIAEIQASFWERLGSDTAAKGGSASAIAHCTERTWDVVGSGRGLDAQQVGLPPLTDCIALMNDLSQQYADELLLKQELLDSIQLQEATPDLLQGIAQLWSLQTKLQPGLHHRLRLLVESLTVGSD